MNSNITRRKFIAGTGGIAAGLTTLGATPSKVFAAEKLILVFLVQKHIVRGLTLGAVKG